MRRVKRRIFSGTVCEQEVYLTTDQTTPVRQLEGGKVHRLRFRDEEERKRHREGMARRAHIRAFNANFGPSSLYATLTMDNEHEVHTFEDAKRVRERYIRRLLHRHPQAVIFAYLGRGENTRRIHMHMVCEGIPEQDIIGLWRQGRVCRLEHLREVNYDISGRCVGRDYSGLANYLFDHWTPEQGGHHYYKSRTARPCDREEATDCKTAYSETRPPRPPKAPEGYTYELVDVFATSYGYYNFRYVMLPIRRPPGRPKKQPDKQNERN